MANINGTEINLEPTEGMRAEAERYRAWREEGRQGGTDVAATRASQILSGDELSPDTVITMAAWFARHEVDKQGEGFSPDEDGYPSPGRVAWAAWGGDPGQTWSSSKAETIKAAEDERSAVSTLNLSANTAPVDLRELNSQSLRRLAPLDYQEVLARAAQADEPEEDLRSFEFSFSSESPVERWFGREVLSHEAGSIDLGRLNDGAPLLWNHNPDQVIGVVERGWIDGEKRRGMARVRFSRSAFAEEKLADVRDGILRNVSVGYQILDAAPLRVADQEVILATSWQPLEISLVSIPADAGVGLGRAAQLPAAPAASTPDPNPMEPTIDLEAVRAQAAADERSRVASITGLCREHGADDLAQGLIERGASEADAMKDVLAAIKTRATKQPATPAVVSQPIARSADIGLSEREVQEFSFLRALRAQLFPNERQYVEAAAFEREVSAATAQRMGMAPKGLVVPNDVLSRALTAGSSASAGDLIFTDARPGSFIELLRKRNVLTSLGVTVLSGLTGPVAIPKQTGAAQAYWVGEQGEATESDPTVGQVNMTAKTLSAWTRFSRLLMLQSSIDVETMVRNELATVMALEQARAMLYGSGTSNQPLGLKFVTGINTEDFGAAQPTYAELVSMETKIAADDADIGAFGYVTNATIYGGFKTTEKATGTAQFVLEPGGTVNSYSVVRSNQVESGDVFLGVWNQLILGLWGALDLQVNPYSEDKAGNVRVVVHQSCDIAVRYPEAFCRGNNTL
jgi:HK97 family phage major capsid protein